MTTSSTRRGLGAAMALALSFTTAACGSGTSAPVTTVRDSGRVLDAQPPPVTSDYSWPEAKVPEGYYPVTVQSCGEDVTFDSAPKRAVVNDDNMIELMFALGLTDRMAAYASAGPRLRLKAFTDDYAAVDDLGPDYFTLEPTLGQEPDFVFSGWNYGYDADGINPDALGELGISSYALNESCRRIDETLKPATIEEWYGDVRNIAKIFGVPERAEALIDSWERRLDRVAELLPDEAAANPVRVFSYSWGTDAPGGGLGLTIVPELYRAAGALNVFADLQEMWGTVSWEAFVESKPELIAVTDFGTAGKGQTGAEKIAYLKSITGVDTVPAVRNDRFLVLPQEAVNPGIRIVDGIEAMAAMLYPVQFQKLAGTDGFGLSPTAD